MNSEFNRLVEIMKKLRGPEGCPWDREQTISSLKKYLIEETYEVVEAMDALNYEHLCEELGDLMLQIVFQSQIASEEGRFTIDDVARGISDKLVHRHPHIWGDVKVDSADEVYDNWQVIKGVEKKDRKYLLDGITKALPALLYAEKAQKKAAKVGFDWTQVSDVLKKLEEEVAELHAAIEKKDQQNIDEEIGDILFSVVNVSRFVKVNAEDSLKQAVEKFIRRFNYIEDRTREMNKTLENMSFKEMDSLWDESKEYNGNINNRKSV